MGLPSGSLFLKKKVYPYFSYLIDSYGAMGTDELINKILCSIKVLKIIGFYINRSRSDPKLLHNYSFNCPTNLLVLHLSLNFHS